MSEDPNRASTESADIAPSPSSWRNVVTAAPVERDSSRRSSDAGSASSPCLRNAATAAPGEKVASLESADESVRAYDEDEIAHTGRLPTQFLDGAAGVMYTSFLGLILDDLIALGTGKYKKC